MSSATALGPLAVAVPIVGACALLPFGSRLRRPIIDTTTIAVASCVAVLDTFLFIATGTGRVVTWLGHWTPTHGHSVGIVLVADRLGAGVALLAAVLTVLALVFSWRHLQGAEGHFHALMLLFLAGMNGFALTGDLFDMFVFFELMGAAAYALTGFKVGDPTSIQGGLNFGIVNSLGAYVTLVGIGLVYGHTGQLGLAQIGAALHGQQRHAVVVIAFVLVITGWLVKAAMVPFHFWLADAHAVAPTPVCVLFSGVMVELGVYAVFRVYSTAFHDAVPEDVVRRALLIFGVATAAVGAVMCLAERHLKRLLAYSTIAHVGLFVCAAATMDPPGIAGSAVYVAGHAGAKSALFLIAGVLLNRFHTVDELSLHGRGRELRFAAALYGIAGLALAGMPPFGTGLGKAIGEDALGKSGYWIGPILFVAVSAMTGGAVLRAGGRIFLGLGPRPTDLDEQESTGNEEHPETDQTSGREPSTMTAPAVVLIVGCLLVGVLPAVAHSLGAGAGDFLDHRAYVAQVLHDRAPTAAPVPEDVSWTTKGVLLDLISTMLALFVAAAGIWAPRYRARMQQMLRPTRAAFGVLRDLHSGHVGDYVAFLFLGTAMLAATVGVPLITR